MKHDIMDDFQKKLSDQYGDVKKKHICADFFFFQMQNNISFFIKTSYLEDLYCLSYHMKNDITFVVDKGNISEKQKEEFSNILNQLIKEKYTNQVLWIDVEEEIHFVRENGKPMYELFQFAEDLLLKKELEWKSKWNFQGYAKIRNQQRDYLYAVDLFSGKDNSQIPFGAFGSKKELVQIMEEMEKEIERLYQPVQQVLKTIKNTFPSYIQKATYHNIKKKFESIQLSFDIGVDKNTSESFGTLIMYIQLEEYEVIVLEKHTNVKDFQNQMLNCMMRLIIIEDMIIEYASYASNAGDLFLDHERNSQERSSMKMDDTIFYFSESCFRNEKSSIHLHVCKGQTIKKYVFEGDIDTIIEKMKPIIVEFAKQMRMKLLFKKRHQND